MAEISLTILPQGITIPAAPGENLLSLLRCRGLAPEAPCGGQGSCGKCRVLVNGRETLACRTQVTESMTVTLPERGTGDAVLTVGPALSAPVDPACPGEFHLAYDIGTTTLVCALLDGRTGRTLASAGMANPQRAYGADVISRIQQALHGRMEDLTRCVREAMTTLGESLCRQTMVSPEDIGVVAVVGNSCMQQLFLGLSPENLASVPFAPLLRRGVTAPAGAYLPLFSRALLLTPPDISGYVGADTVACLLATGQHRRGELTLLVDIGTNGELVLGNREGLAACSTAAGPALEGANIRFGMTAREGAIHRVWAENGDIRCQVLGGGTAAGICGSGLIDAVAAMLDLGAVDHRGRIQTPKTAPHMAHRLREEAGHRRFYLTEEVYLTQQDIRQVQLAKGAIAAGIRLMGTRLGVAPEEIGSVALAGAFGSAIRPESAARIGLIPEQFLPRVTAIGNAALAGAKILALDRQALARTEELVSLVTPVELAEMEEFQKIFVENTLFPR